MLVDQKMFDTVEAFLRENGSIERFENECGKIKGRMMITLTHIPEGIPVKERDGMTPVAFEASFDFYNSTIGLAIYTADRQVATGLWVTPQKKTPRNLLMIGWSSLSKHSLLILQMMVPLVCRFTLS